MISPVTPVDEIVRAKMGIFPRNYLAAVHQTNQTAEWDEQNVTSMQGKVEIVRQFYNHCSAVLVRKAVGERIWNSYYKFCFERNPWERVISEYYFILKTKPELQGTLSLEKFVREKQFSPNYPLYMENGNLVVDRVCRFETLQEDLTQVCQHLNIPYDGWLPQTKVNKQNGSGNPKEKLSPELENIVTGCCQPEIDLLGYSLKSAT